MLILGKMSVKESSSSSSNTDVLIIVTLSEKSCSGNLSVTDRQTDGQSDRQRERRVDRICGGRRRCAYTTRVVDRMRGEKAAVRRCLFI